jgi:hypothetical protein
LQHKGSDLDDLTAHPSSTAIVATTPSRATGLPLAIDQAAHDRGKDFLFAPSPPNLRLMSEGEKDGYR